jgi:valyl-tRNA synthetase
VDADVVAAQRIDTVQRLITEVRRFRADQGLKPGQKVPARLSGVDEADIANQLTAIRAIARLEEPADGFTASASLEVGGVHVELDTSGTIDVAAERKRLAKDLAAAEKELAQCDGKLNNPAFVDKAPAQVVDKIKARREAAVVDIARVAARLDALPEG